jgi:hypothetical protein
MLVGALDGKALITLAIEPPTCAQCRAYCQRQGWEVVEVFCEPGASGLDDERADFQEMIYKATRPD